MPKLTDSIDKQLKEVVKRLPVTGTLYDSFGLEILPNRKINHFRASFEIVPGSVNPTILNDSINVIKIPKQRMFPVKHIRRLRKAYQERGIPGVEDYVKWVYAQNKMIIDSAEQMLAMRLVTDISTLL